MPAHISLFHRLPGQETESVLQIVRRLCSQQSPIAIRIASLRNLGRGVAYQAESTELAGFRKQLANFFTAWLTPQDRQRYRSHITVQNKVSPKQARRALEELSGEPYPPSITGIGVAIWRYLNGPWECVEVCRFERF